MPTSSKAKIAVHALVDWIGEAIVGLVPLIAFKIISLFSRPIATIYYCPTVTDKVDIHTAAYPRKALRKKWAFSPSSSPALLFDLLYARKTLKIRFTLDCL